MYKILTYNNISPAGLERFPRERYEVASEIQHPDAVMLRSFDLHGVAIPVTLKAVGRAGAGVNNIPVADYTQRGIPVFNAPGANANAVKELALAGMLLAARKICPAWHYALQLEGDGKELNAQVEKGKKQFAGFELAGRTLAVLGLGAIGVKVANAAMDLGMEVIGYDPQLTVESAWQLSSLAKRAASIDELIAKADFVTLHVPLNEHTRHVINAARLDFMKKGAILLNFSREPVVDEDAVLSALDTGQLSAYVCDFPSRKLLNHPGVTALPHLGASTAEAEDNCAIMVADQLRDYLENGNIRNSVNLPEVVVPRIDAARLCIVNENVPNMVGQVSGALAEANLNILDLINKSRGDVAYTLVDLNSPVPDATLERIRAITGVLSARVI
jgi:D-3-phosphoglycerate dehydrogenase / 2-oxoglutarate reductase